MTSYFKLMWVERKELAWVVVWLVASQLAAAADLPAKQDDPGLIDGRRDLVLKSESWRKTMADLDEWYSAQPIYDPKQVADIKQQTSRRVQAMSADQIEEFRQDVEAKLAVLQSPEGLDILHWVAANRAAAAPAYRKKLDLEYPDVARLNAAQLREQLYLLAEKRSAAQNRITILERTRQSRIAALQEAQRLQYEERDRAFARGVATFGKGGYSFTYQPSVRRYPEVVSRGYGFGFGFGFGIW